MATFQGQFCTRHDPDLAAHNGFDRNVFGERAAPRAGRHGERPDTACEAAPCSEAEIRQRLREVIGDDRYKAVASRTGFNPETVRRYLTSDCRIPAEFVAVVAVFYGVDPGSILVNNPAAEHAPVDADREASDAAESLAEALLPLLRSWFLARGCQPDGAGDPGEEG